MKKLNLNIDINFKIFGIVSDKNNYSLVSEINSKLNCNFSQKDNLKINSKLNSKEFNVFESYNKDLNIKYRFIDNKNQNVILIKNLKEINYIFQIIGDISDKDLKIFINKIKSINSILMFTEIEKSTINNIKVLNF